MIATSTAVDAGLIFVSQYIRMGQFFLAQNPISTWALTSWVRTMAAIMLAFIRHVHKSAHPNVGISPQSARAFNPRIVPGPGQATIGVNESWMSGHDRPPLDRRSSP